ncbi:MAG: CvpA family protein [Candidatus Amulumruptor caecigallinarius]|nr:CvpA family protein [Candidatus Amulumruptor caecigallinarius]MCM1397092.1 CvpA family protein [Candidatus Amulumruptor caecigallinarius]MCM1454078.1 CvpA family protein [bacterium]
MNFLDIVIIIMLLGGLVVGFRKGLVASLGALLAVALACVACHLLGSGRGVPANILIFVVAYVTVLLLSRMLRTVIHAVALGFVDRAAGALFVAFEYMLGLSLLLNLFLWLRSLADASPPAFMATSRWGDSLVALMPWFTGCLQSLMAQ